MSENFDFNIDNYSTDNLISFFRLHNNYDFKDLDKRAKEMTLSVVSSNNSSKYKYELIEFIQKAQELLINVKNDDNDRIIKKNIQTSDNKDESNIRVDNVGKIINPLSAHPSLQRQKIHSDTTNPYNYHTNTTNYIFNTLFRDDYFNTLPDNCSFTMPTTIKNVVAISLSGIQVPNVSSNFSEVTRTNQIFIREDVTNIEGIVSLPSGNYTLDLLIIDLEKAINIQLLGSWPNRFTVTILQHQRNIIISNSTYTFTINIIKKDKSLYFPHSCLYDIDKTTNTDNIDSKNKLKPSDLYNTMGYLIGYRKPEYNGLKSYVAESVFVDTFQDYYYLELNDYTGYQHANTIGVLPTGLISNNIIAILPITTPKYIASFDNNSNFIFKTRNYLAPINLKKISIRFLGPEGELIDLKQTDFAFCLQVSTLYDNIMPFNTTDVSLAS
jgi:hypothetical protein